MHGDIPDVLFGHFSGKYDEILDWVASSGLDYLATKVLTKQYEFDADMADEDLKAMLAEAKGERSEYSPNWPGQIEEVIHLFQYERTEHALYSAADGLAGYEEFSGVGQVVNSDIIWCQEMVRKLLELQGHGSPSWTT